MNSGSTGSSTAIIPVYLYVTARTPQEAAIKKSQVESLLNQAMVKGLIDNNVPNLGIRVMDPIPAPDR